MRRILLWAVAAVTVWLLASPAYALGSSKLRVGSEVDFQPYSDVDAQGQAIGFAVELFAAVANESGLRYSVQPDKWDSVWHGLTTGELDALPLVAKLKEREELVEFTQPHTVGYDSFFVRRGHEIIESIEHARGLRIMVMRSDAAHHALAGRGFTSQLVFVDTLAEGLRLLASGENDALLAPVLQGNMLIHSLGLSEAVEGGPAVKEYRREFCFAVSKGNQELRDQLDQGLRRVKLSGEYDRLYRKWLGIYEPATFPKRYFWWGAATVLALLSLLFLWTWTLRRQVALRTVELKRLNENLQQAQASLQLSAKVFTHSRDGIVITDDGGSILQVNDAFTRITGYSREEVLGRNPRILNSGHHQPDFYQALWKSLLEQDYWSGEIWNRRKCGEIYPEMLTISTIRDGDGKTVNYLALFSDITALKDQQQLLEHIAHYDPLTELPNRVLLTDRLRQALIRSSRNGMMVGVAYLDLDGFKAVNDQYGHETGDKLLVALAQRMKASLRQVDTLARLGGDEFVAVLVDLDQPRDCEPLLERLLQAASDPVTIDESLIRVSVSIGATIYPQDIVDADQLIRHADQAMYLAKNAGKNRYHMFDVIQDVADKSLRESIEKIRSAIRDNQFVLHYQPKVNMDTGTVVGAEALIRWLHPERGLLPPGAFLPAIENDALIVELGGWVIDTALSQIATWRRQGLEIAVSVNIAARQLQEGSFLNKLRESLGRHWEVEPHYLELEVLETSALEEIEQVSSIMRGCRELGVRFALDDFGTGYSSLTYLRRLPADTLKIDRSFVSNIVDTPEDRAIVAGVIGLAKAFQRSVIAEGVETKEHGIRLLSLGCQLAQGYGIARPMPASALETWMNSWLESGSWREWRSSCNEEKGLGSPSIVPSEVAP